MKGGRKRDIMREGRREKEGRRGGRGGGGKEGGERETDEPSKAMMSSFQLVQREKGAVWVAATASRSTTVPLPPGF